MKSIYQKTMTPIRSIEVRDVIRDSLHSYQSQYEKVYLFLDEPDFFDSEDADALVHLCRRIKEILPRGSVMILANRDLGGAFSKAFQNPQSLVRSTFRHHHRLDALWLPGQANLPRLLEKRMQRGKPHRGYRFPFEQEACKVLDILAGGNLKLLLQYVETSLMDGAIQQQQAPLSADFVAGAITAQFNEAKINDEDEHAVLTHLQSEPTHVSDPKFKNIIGSRTALQELLAKLEERGLVERETKRTGVKQTYSITEKGKMLLSR